MKTPDKNILKVLDSLAAKDQIKIFSSRNAQMLKYISNEKTQIFAIKRSPLFIRYINNPSEKIQLMCVRQIGGHAIGYISDPSEKVQLAAIKNWPESFHLIKKPTKKVRELHKKLSS